MAKMLGSLAVKAVSQIGNPLSIVIYHRVLPEVDPLLPSVVDARQFEQHLVWYKQNFDVIPLSQAIDQLASGSIRRRSLCITFDDGYEDNVEIALPLLLKHGLPAMFFVTTAYLNGGMMWNDMVLRAVRDWPEPFLSVQGLELPPLAVSTTEEKQRSIRALLDKLKYLPEEKRRDLAVSLVQIVEDHNAQVMMTEAQLKELARSGMEIGGHTHSHPILSSISDSEAAREIEENQSILTSIIGIKPDIFAYPNGCPGRDYDARHIRAVRDCGYRAATSTEWGSTGRLHDRYQLPRFTPWDSDESRFLFRMARNIISSGKAFV